jgi:hypothetical protein
MSKFDQIIQAIKLGKKVTSCGNKIVAENIDYSWQKPELRVELINGASYPLDGNELKYAKIL